jgi:hypothetical protein
MFDAVLSQNVQPAATVKVAEISKSQIPGSRQFSKPKFQKRPSSHSLKRATKWDLSFCALGTCLGLGTWDLGFSAEGGWVPVAWNWIFQTKKRRSINDQSSRGCDACRRG